VKNLIFITLLLLAFQSCKTRALLINDGAKAYEQKKFVLASDLLKKEIANENDLYKKIEKLQLLADAFDEMDQPAGKVNALQQIKDLDANPQYLFDLALAQKENEEYTSALSSFKTYKALMNDSYYTDPQIKLCEEAISYLPAKSNIKIANLEQINSSASDYAPRLYKNGAIVFTSARASSVGDLVQPWDNQKSSDLFFANKNKGIWEGVENFSEVLNTPLAEGIATFSKNFETVYFTRCDYLDLGNSFCRIFQAEADGDTWYEAGLLSIFSDSVNIGQPHLSADGQRLYFSSDAPFGYGKNDIYFMIKNGAEWSQPYNAGFFINTEKDEVFPTTDSKGNIYFSSNGKTGYGGLDIYKAAPDKFAFAPASLLPYPINSGADDFSFIFIKEAVKGSQDMIIESALFSSSRKGGKGNDDIYKYEKLFINFYVLDLSIIEKKYENPLNGESNVLGMQALPGAIVLMKGQEKISPVDGKLKFILEAETDYKILISKTNYFNRSIEFSTKELRSTDSLTITIFKEVALEKIFPEKEIVIENIYYDYDKATLREESLPILDKLVSFFDENQDLKIEIGSHTDSRGSDQYNQDLSQRRAQSVVDYFIAKGVPSAQLSAKGYGESKLINECANGVECSEEKHQKNRRTTFRVISAAGVLESGK
jgi:outer membrane protein OmpA-like peptidoglycan-associated protein